MIEVKHLIKRYGTHTAVNDVSFSIDKGRIYGFLGPNGAGKTMNTANQVCLRQIACRHSAILSLSTTLVLHIRLLHTAGITTASTANTIRHPSIGQITK